MDDDEPIGWHLTFRARDSRILAPDSRAQRMLAETVHRIGARFQLFGFRASDDHLHTVNACTRAEASAFAQALGSSLAQSFEISAGFFPCHFEAMWKQSHVDRTFSYVLGNEKKHRVDLDPLHDASSIQELLGLRLGPEGFIQRVRSKVRRVSRELLLGLLEVAGLEPAVRGEWLADAAAGAVGLAALDASDRAARARAAAVRVAAAELRPAVIADALSLSERSVRRLRAGSPDPDLERAIALRMGHRLSLGERASPTRPFK
ncbi:MAG: hypothetical protein ACOZNI_28515 [Myxococcota bacterium]